MNLKKLIGARDIQNLMLGRLDVKSFLIQKLLDNEKEITEKINEAVADYEMEKNLSPVEAIQLCIMTIKEQPVILIQKINKVNMEVEIIKKFTINDLKELI